MGARGLAMGVSHRPSSPVTMYPLGHLAFGYVAYSIASRLTRDRTPSGWPVFAVLFGTQFPDLIDKPLSWWFHVLPGGRTFAHSIYVVVTILAVTGYVSARLDRTDLAWAFSLGYVSHLVGDSVYAVDLLSGGKAGAINFLAWPLTHPIVYVVRWHMVPYLESTALTPTFGIEVLFGVLVVALWISDGRPGTNAIRFGSASDE